LWTARGDGIGEDNAHRKLSLERCQRASRGQRRQRNGAKTGQAVISSSIIGICRSQSTRFRQVGAGRLAAAVIRRTPRRPAVVVDSGTAMIDWVSAEGLHGRGGLPGECRRSLSQETDLLRSSILVGKMIRRARSALDGEAIRSGLY
jgi:hypothetical protein